jgi:peptidyl-prolyl cis-trans isomerase B (cyclophilin B)
VAGKGKQTSAERRRERQAAARMAAAKRARKVRLQAAAGVLALAVVGGGVAGAVVHFKGDDTPAKPPKDLSTSPAPSANQAGAPAGKVNCNYVMQPPPPSTAPDSVNPKHPTFPPSVAENTAPAYATLDTSEGQIVWELDAAKAPCSVNSFVSLANQHFYDNTICHRLLNDSEQNLTYATLQCGDPTGTGKGGPGYKFADENLDGAIYTQGLVAMANAGPNTNGSQFFMMFKKSDFDPSYTPFAHILTGMDVLEKIAAGGAAQNPVTQQNDKPNITLTIKTVTISNTPPKGVSTAEPTSYPTPSPTPTKAAKGSKSSTATPTPTPTPTSTPTP